MTTPDLIDARSRSELESACALVRERLREEAERREWCSEYGAFVDDINRSLGWELLAHCRTTAQTVTATVTFQVGPEWVTDGLWAALDGTVRRHAGDLVGEMSDLQIEIGTTETLR